ncbi:alpha-rhamnosidase [Mucilaginibacter hurinus]|uniref:alpha-L-rhamnosidase n=1 Tax=Mucilaginibacter hurinus TaxID=2201324 RepID=A0A367GU77_9SPHI|nr:alpha-L-rhamnosidase [Mucilaginibacter hurinus]RCH56253.1 alpha-rhamnosidase [Mucilaginibacter hurinus]
MLSTYAIAQVNGLPVALKCEYLVNPVGIDASAPRLTWQLHDTRPGALQQAYTIYLGTDSLKVKAGDNDLVMIDKIADNKNLITYSGKSLTPFTRYFWRVDVWDKENKRSSSAIASFETGMLNSKNWQGNWISDNHDIHTKPAPYFRKIFEAGKRIKSARAYIAAAGLYELYINGQKTGNHRLDPMYTRFDRRNLYVSYDVTRQIQQGKNAIGVLLGNGWYNHQSSSIWNFDKAPWRNRPAFCLDLRVTYEDGSVETIVTDRGWKTSLSPVIFNSIYTAEHYDARLEQPGWNTINYDDSSWDKVILRSVPSNNIVAQSLHPIRNVQEIAAVTFQKFNDTAYQFNLGRNVSGVSRITIKGDSGTVVRIKHGERLYPNGRIDQSNIDHHYHPVVTDDPFQTDIFILSGKSQETFMPKFNYKGFQYVEVSANKPIVLNQSSLTGYFMHSDVPAAGRVTTSNPVIDKIWTATNNSYLSNLFGYPTDCPQREKNGWTGDAHIASETGLYNFDGITIYEKWLADHRDEQQPNGVLPSIIPTGGWGYEWGNGPDWTSTIAIIPWNLYLFYGDSKPLTDNYNNIKRYVDHINELYPGGLTDWGLGDWVPVKSKSPVEFTSSAYYYVDVTILAKAADLLGKPADAAKYHQLANKIKDAINAKYLNNATATYGTGTQTELSVALYWGLVPQYLKARVAARLAARVIADNYHLDVGLLGTKSILNALSENGYADIAFKIAAQEDYPSWGWWIKNGATTLYENWNIQSKYDISLNHIMFGEVGAWLYKGIGGIFPDEKRPGFEHIHLRPNFVKELQHYASSHEGPRGRITSTWLRKGNQISYTVIIPANSTATIYINPLNGQHIYGEDKRVIKNGPLELVAGTYNFEVR